jgi:hypothetical protein
MTAIRRVVAVLLGLVLFVPTLAWVALTLALVGGWGAVLRVWGWTAPVQEEAAPVSAQPPPVPRAPVLRWPVWHDSNGVGVRKEPKQ